MNCWQKRTQAEKRCLVTTVILILFVALIVTCVIIFTRDSHCHSPACIKTSHQILEVADLHQDPCKNFSKYACGNPKNRQWVNDTSFELKSILLEPPREYDAKSLRLQKLYYKSCTNLTAIEIDNNEAFLSVINKIGGWPVVGGNNWNESAYDFVELMVSLREAGLKFDWFLEISTYSRDEDASKTILQIGLPKSVNKINKTQERDYVSLMAEVAVFFKAHEHFAKVEMRDVMYLETRLANLIEEVQRENERQFKNGPPISTIAEVQVTWQKINWIELLNQITNNQLSNHDQVAFFAKNYLSKLDGLLKQHKKRTQVNYVVWKLVEHYHRLLATKVREKIADFYKFHKNRYEEHEDYCFNASKNFFRYALEASYLRRHVPQSKQHKIENIVERIKRKIETHLDNVKWMDQITREAALNKLRDVSVIIGGPEEMYYTDQFDYNYIGVKNISFDSSSNVIEMTTEATSKMLDESFDMKEERKKNLQKQKFYGRVASLEVEFLRDYNLLYIPAGALQNFLYDEGRPNYLNYGTLGALIGRQLTHGFDHGKISNKIWWSNETQKMFENSTKCLLDDCNKQEGCQDEIRESLGYSAGINLAYEAYEEWLAEHNRESSIPGLVLTGNQMIWLAYGALTCHMSAIDSNRSFVDRIVEPLKNSPHFAEDFSCPHETPMNPLNKCQVL